MNSVSDIVSSFINNKEIIDNKNFITIAEKLIDCYQLRNFVNDIRFIKDKSDIAGCYHIDKRMITINSLELENIANNLCRISKKLNYNISYDYMYIFSQLITLLHELQHARQRKQLYNFVTDFKSYIISKIICDCFSVDVNLYNKKYLLFPIEKDADFFSYSTTTNLFLDSLVNDNEFYQFLGRIIYVQITCGYSSDLTGCDLVKFYNEIVKDADLLWRILQAKESLTFSEKIRFNFPLNRDDMINMRNLKNEIYNGDNEQVKKTLKKFLVIK